MRSNVSTGSLTSSAYPNEQTRSFINRLLERRVYPVKISSAFPLAVDLPRIDATKNGDQQRTLMGQIDGSQLNDREGRVNMMRRENY